MFSGIDRSKTLSRSLEGMSARLAKRRGLLPVVGVGLIILSFIIRLIMFALPQAAPGAEWILQVENLLDLAWIITHHLGILLGLIGLLLVEPIGR